MQPVPFFLICESYTLIQYVFVCNYIILKFSQEGSIVV